MKLCACCVIISLTWVSTASAAVQRSAYYDALYLKQIINKEHGKFAIAVVSPSFLHYYFGPDTTSGAVDSAIRKNKFLEPFYVPKTRWSIAGAPSISFPSGLIQGAAGVDVTNIADGIAKFMVERFESELDLAFFKKLKDELSSPKYKYLADLFPQTMSTLKVMDKDIYHYTSYIVSLRQSFKTDISNLYVHFGDLIKEPEIANFLDTNRLLSTIIRSSLYFANQVSLKEHPGDIIANYVPSYFRLPIGDSCAEANVRGAIQVLKLFSASLRESDSSRGYWVQSDSVRLLVEDTTAFKIYLGLIYQRGKDILFGHHVSFGQIMDAAAHYIMTAQSVRSKYQDFVNNVAMDVNNLDVNTKEILAKEKQNEAIDYTQYYAMFDDMLDVVQESLKIYDLPYVAKVLNDKDAISRADLEAQRWLWVARTTGYLYVDVKTKNYSSAVMHLSSVIDTLRSLGGNRFPISAEFSSAFLKYGTFMANVVTAKNSDDVKNAIENIALPVGSYSIKREDPTNVSINGYIGGFGAAEYLPILKNSNWGPSGGLTAPIGIAFSCGRLCLPAKSDPSEQGGSFTVFLSVIDVGTVASFRIQNDSSSVAPDVKLADIFALGLYFYYGFPNSPISIGIGGQVGPQFHSISAAETNENQNYYFRVGATLAVDIPLLNL